MAKSDDVKNEGDQYLEEILGVVYDVPLWQECECGKRGWSSFEKAKDACTFIGNRIRVYRCKLNPRFLHFTNHEKDPRALRLEKRILRGHHKKYKRASLSKKFNEED